MQHPLGGGDVAKAAAGRDRHLKRGCHRHRTHGWGHSVWKGEGPRWDAKLGSRRLTGTVYTGKKD